jgi:NAD dependent epimerase/dehydratase family
MCLQPSRTCSWAAICCYARREYGRRVPTWGNFAPEWKNIHRESTESGPNGTRSTLKLLTSSKSNSTPLRTGLLLRASLTPYGASKAAGFTLLRTTAIEQAFEFFYGRIFTVYGDGQCGLNFWPSLKKAATDGRDFPMTSGTQISDFIHATQVADHFLAACERNDIDASRPPVSAKKSARFDPSTWGPNRRPCNRPMTPLCGKPSACG